jgi:hypothetical protein
LNGSVSFLIDIVAEVSVEGLIGVEEVVEDLIGDVAIEMFGLIGDDVVDAIGVVVVVVNLIGVVFFL